MNWAFPCLNEASNPQTHGADSRRTAGYGSTRLRIHPSLVALFLALTTLIVYWPVTTHEFISYDDPAYVTANPMVQAGLSWKGIAWAFTRIAGEHTYWHPLTWLSHMLDCQLFGLNAGAHHAVNLLFHTLNVVLLFLVLRTMTGALWRCAFVAALFALHPLQVDTVAWVAERKNVLSTFFAFLSLLFYARHVQTKIENRKSKIVNYIWALFFFACCLMSKPMLVTLPFVMLLLDYWPLNRFSIFDFRFSIWKLVREKLPFFVFSAASSLITILAHQRLKMVWTAEQLPFSWRLERAATSYLRYLRNVLWPDRLAIFYPIERHVSAWQVTGACLVLAGISLWVLWRVRPIALAGRGLVLVPWHARAGDRPVAGRQSVHCGPVRLCAGHWPVPDGRMGWTRDVRALASASGASDDGWVGGGRFAGGLRGADSRSTRLLAEQRNAFQPCHRGDQGQLSGL